MSEHSISQNEIQNALREAFTEEFARDCMLFWRMYTSALDMAYDIGPTMLLDRFVADINNERVVPAGIGYKEHTMEDFIMGMFDGPAAMTIIKKCAVFTADVALHAFFMGFVGNNLLNNDTVSDIVREKYPALWERKQNGFDHNSGNCRAILSEFSSAVDHFIRLAGDDLPPGPDTVYAAWIAVSTFLFSHFVFTAHARTGDRPVSPQVNFEIICPNAEEIDRIIHNAMDELGETSILNGFVYSAAKLYRELGMVTACYPALAARNWQGLLQTGAMGIATALATVPPELCAMIPDLQGLTPVDIAVADDVASYSPAEVEALASNAFIHIDLKKGWCKKCVEILPEHSGIYMRVEGVGLAVKAPESSISQQRAFITGYPEYTAIHGIGA